MTGTFYGHQFRFRWNHFHGAPQLFDRAEGISGAVHEECGRTQIGEMLRALLLEAAGRMQRIGEQQQAGNEIGFFGAEHAGLAAAVGMAAEEDAGFFLRAKIPASGNPGQEGGTQTLFHRGRCILESGAVAGSVSGAGWAERSSLTKRQIASQDGKSGGRKRFGQGAEQRGVGIPAGAVGEDEAVAI